MENNTSSTPANLGTVILAELRPITPDDPARRPREIALIEAVRARRPRLPQDAGFDTAFHRTMPRVAKLLPIPRRDAKQGIERYGFHGLSCHRSLATFNAVYGTCGGIVALLSRICLPGGSFIFGACLCAAQAEPISAGTAA